MKKPLTPEILIRHEAAPNARWDQNQYGMDIAKRLKIEPWRLQCDLKVRPGGGFILEIQKDGQDLNSAEERIAMDYLEEAFFGIKPRTEG